MCLVDLMHYAVKDLGTLSLLLEAVYYLVVKIFTRVY